TPTNTTCCCWRISTATLFPICARDWSADLASCPARISAMSAPSLRRYTVPHPTLPERILPILRPCCDPRCSCCAISARPTPPARVLQNFIDCQKKRKGAVTLIQQRIGEPLQGFGYFFRTRAPHDNWQGGSLRLQNLSDLNAVHARHVDVKYHYVNVALASDGNSAETIGSGEDLIPLFPQ